MGWLTGTSRGQNKVSFRSRTIYIFLSVGSWQQVYEDIMVEYGGVEDFHPFVDFLKSHIHRESQCWVSGQEVRGWLFHGEWQGRRIPAPLNRVMCLMITF